MARQTEESFRQVIHNFSTQIAQTAFDTPVVILK